jgi:hypothetical protein
MREIIDVLGLLVAADQARREVQDWGLYYTAGGPIWVGGSGWPDDVAVASTAEIDEMAERGRLRITGYPSDKGRQFAVTGDGRQAWLDHVHANAPEAPGGGPATLDWESSRTLLRALYDAYAERGAPRRGAASTHWRSSLASTTRRAPVLSSRNWFVPATWSRPLRSSVSGLCAPPPRLSRCSLAGPQRMLRTHCRLSLPP